MCRDWSAYQASRPHGFWIWKHHCTGCRLGLSRTFSRFDLAGVLSILATLARILLGVHK